MKEKIDINTWLRKDHFNFFNTFEEPFFGVTVDVDCTLTYQEAKDNNESFFLLYLHKAILAANRIAPFRYRIIENEVWAYDEIHVSTTVGRLNGTFGFGYINFKEDFDGFKAGAELEIDQVKAANGLILNPRVDLIHFSALPWLDFKSMSHARSYAYKDSCPKISFGKCRNVEGKKMMCISIHVNHALMDGYHVSQFVEEYQKLLNQKNMELISA